MNIESMYHVLLHSGIVRVSCYILHLLLSIQFSPLPFALSFFVFKIFPILLNSIATIHKFITRLNGFFVGCFYIK